MFLQSHLKAKASHDGAENTSRDVVFFGYHHRLVRRYHVWARWEGNLILIVRGILRDDDFPPAEEVGVERKRSGTETN